MFTHARLSHVFLVVGAVMTAVAGQYGGHQSSPVNRLFFTSSLKGWTVGETGIARTTDGGKTWTSFTDSLLAAVESESVTGFLGDFSPGSLWLVIENQTVVRSSDGGRSWRKVATEVDSCRVGSTRFIQIQARDPTTAYLTGCCADREAGQEVVFTLLISPEVTTPATRLPVEPGTFRGVHFSDALEGWLLQSHSLSHTTDGGRSWAIVHRSEQPLTGFSPLGSGRCVLLTAHTLSLVSIPWGAVMVTFPSCVESVCFFQRVGFQNGVLWVSLGSLAEVGDSGEVETSPQLYRSLDRGRTWQRLAEVPVGGSPTAYMLDDSFGWLLAPESISSRRIEIYRTQDGGRTWELVFRGPPPG